MDITYKELPFPHVIIDNVYNEQELSLIMTELKFLTQPWKLRPAEYTRTAVSEDNTPLKKNNAVWLDQIYTSKEYSDILRLSCRLFHPEFKQLISNFHYSLKYLQPSNEDSCLLSYYESGDGYKAHTDRAVLTFLTHFYKEPKSFTGGNIVFPEYDYELETVNNRTILFPSIIQHAVREIKLNEGIEKFSGYGRYTLSQFIGMTLFK